MLLAIDAGNTNVVFALLDGAERLHHWRIATDEKRTADEYMVWISQLLSLSGHDRREIDGAIIATVVPPTKRPLTELCRRYFGCEPVIVGAADTALDIRVSLPNVREVGADRLVNAVAGWHLLEGPHIAIDFGTATTFDIIGPDKSYDGGLIAPGINLSIRALYEAAARLPRIAVEPPERENSVIGRSTEQAMQAGVFWGYVGMIEGLVDRIRAELGRPVPVLATGGLAPLFAGHTDRIDRVEGDLTILGLRLIYERNRT